MLYSETLHPLSNYGFNITTLNNFKSDVLNVTYKCKVDIENSEN